MQTSTARTILFSVDSSKCFSLQIKKTKGYLLAHIRFNSLFNTLTMVSIALDTFMWLIDSSLQFALFENNIFVACQYILGKWEKVGRLHLYN